MSESNTRVCRKCNREKLLENFPLSTSGTAKKRKQKSGVRRPLWTCRECMNQYYQRCHREARERVMRHYCGGEPHCQCPGCAVTEYDFLTIDHVGGGGVKHRRRDPTAAVLVRWLIRNNFPEGFRVVCWNCNCAGRKKGNCCPVHEAGGVPQTG